ncbi:MAG: ribonuclease HII [Oscillospiraceae bacterium]|nr:ribonuclease HII [Oscillospiraceae bacterium]
MDYNIEKEALEQGYKKVCGTDEAGRGPLAGPVFAAAVILPCGAFDAGLLDLGLNDSKKLSPKRREALYDIICERSVRYAVATASVEEIDEINILNAAMLAMRRAVEALDMCPGLILVDGNKKPGTDIEEWVIIGGDGLSPSIAAASILAKVSRDRYMAELDKQYPQYCFAKHKGYGTKLHYDMLAEYGPSPVHRKSFNLGVNI